MLVVMHSLLFAIEEFFICVKQIVLFRTVQIHMAIELFNNMKHSGFFPDAATFEMMIDCCSVMGCLKSAFSLLSMMIRSGFCPQILTYTSLVKVFDEFLILVHIHFILNSFWVDIQEDALFNHRLLILFFILIINFFLYCVIISFKV